MEAGELVADRFVLERLAGEGGMGSVWRAYDRHRGETVALKVLRQRVDRAAVERLEREAQVLAELHHPGIVRYVAHGATRESSLFLAMEWIEGETLAARLTQGTLGVGATAALLIAVADALTSVHARGIVHRDLKPQNIMLPGRGVRDVKVVDFGVARWDEVMYAMTGTGIIMGTLGYMAPEQARGVRDLDARVDVFSLGCVAFEALTGRSPFAADTAVATIAKVMLEDAPRVKTKRGDVPDALDALIAAMLSRDPAQRPADGAALRRRLDALGVTPDADEAVRAVAAPQRVLSGDERRPVKPAEAKPPSRGDADRGVGEGTTRTLLGRTTPFVGRERELRTLHATWDECAQDTVARVVLVSGTAGSGKTRLGNEWRMELAARDGLRPMLMLGRGDAARAGAPYTVLSAALRRELGISEVESPAARQSRLRARVAERLTGAEAARVTVFLGELVRAEFADGVDAQLQVARRDPKLMNDQVSRAWIDWLRGECAARPVVMVLDDLQWGDRPSLDLVEAALHALREMPLMVVALTRPEAHANLKHLRAVGGVQELPLGDLSRRAAERLARAMLGDVDAAVIERVIDRAGGNPFVLEELLRAVLEGRGDALPGSVRAAAEARFESMPAGDRRLLRAGSVFGRAFTADALAALLGADATAGGRLDALVLGEVLLRRGDGAAAEYVFRHELLREVAYDALTDEDRALGHALAGRWLEHAGGADALTLADHFERGGDVARAAILWHQAAEQALAANDLDATLSLAERGVRAGATGETLGALRGIEAMVYAWRGELDRSAGCASEAVANLERGDARWYRAASFLASAKIQRGDVGAIEGVIREIVAPLDGGAQRARVMAAAQVALHCLATGLNALLPPILACLDDPRVSALAEGDPIAAAYLCEVRATRATVAGAPLTSMREKARARAFRLQGGDLRGAYTVQVNEAASLLELGDFVRAEELLSEATPVLDRFGLGAMAAYARLCLGLALLGRDARLGVTAAQSRLRLGAAMLGRGARREAQAVISLAVTQSWERGRPRTEALARCALAGVLAADGDLEAAEREVLTALERVTTLPAPRSYALATLASIRLQRGARAAALGDATEAIQILNALGGLDTGDAKVRRIYAEALRATGDIESSVAAIAWARGRVLERASRIDDEGWRESFLTRVEDNARTLALAKEWGVAQG